MNLLIWRRLPVSVDGFFCFVWAHGFFRILVNAGANEEWIVTGLKPGVPACPPK